MSRTIQQVNNINVLGVKIGPVVCPNGTWQRKSSTGNPKDSPMCSALDLDLCGINNMVSWANLETLRDGTQLSFDGLVICTQVPSGGLVPLDPELEEITSPPLETLTDPNARFIFYSIIIFIIIIIIIIIIAAVASSNRK